MMCAAAYGPDAREGEEERGQVVVRQLLAARPAERLEVERAGSDVGRERAEVRAPVAGAHDVAVEALVGGGHRGGGGEGAAVRPVRRPGGGLAEVLDERADHALGRRPGAVRRADRLHDLLEHGRAAHEPAGALRDPGELGVGRGDGVEGGEVLVQPQDVRDRGEDVVRLPRPGARPAAVTRARPASALGDPHRARPRPRQRHGDLERARLLVDPHRRQVDEPVRLDRAPEVDRLAAGAHERQLGAPRATHRRVPAAPTRRPRTPCQARRRPRPGSCRARGRSRRARPRGRGRRRMSRPARRRSRPPTLIAARPDATKKSSSWRVSTSVWSPVKTSPAASAVYAAIPNDRMSKCLRTARQRALPGSSPGGVMISDRWATRYGASVMLGLPGGVITGELS